MNRISFFTATATAVLGLLLAVMGSLGTALVIWAALALTTQSQKIVDAAEEFFRLRARRRASPNRSYLTGGHSTPGSKAHE